MSSPDLKLVYTNLISDPEYPIYLLCVFRDEEILLEYFLEYYSSIGVTHFILVDNLSEDNGVNYIKQQNDLNIMLYRASGSYRDAVYGTSWVNDLLKIHCVNQYCITVDVDELLYFDKTKYPDLHSLIDNMELSNTNVVAATLLDMYPEETNDTYKAGENFLSHSFYFDRLNDKYYHSHNKIYNTFHHKTGGVRERVFNTVVCIHKLPFFKYNFRPLGTGPGYHYFVSEDGDVLYESSLISIFTSPVVLLHFKFIKPALGDFFKRRVVLNQDWDNSSEYKSYSEMVKKAPAFKFYDEKLSVKFKNGHSLKDFFSVKATSSTL